MSRNWILLIGLCTICAAATAQDVKRGRDTVSYTSKHGLEVTEVRTETVTEEVTGKTKVKKSKTRKPKHTKYRVTLLEVEYEAENIRDAIAAADETQRRELLQELINRVAVIKDVKHVEYNTDYTQLVVTLPDDSEYRVRTQ